MHPDRSKPHGARSNAAQASGAPHRHLRRRLRRQATWTALRAVAMSPGRFAWRTLGAFRANQGLLLAGAVAYYALLSIVPLCILIVLVLSRWIEPAVLLPTLDRYLAWLLPGQAQAVTAELQRFLAHREVLGWVLLGSMLFFSSLAFTVLENAMSIVFHHRVAVRRRHALVSALMPYGFILCATVGSLVVVLAAGHLQAVGHQSLWLGEHQWSLQGLSTGLLYALGIAGELLLLTAIYLVMPVGRLRIGQALFGASVATVLWELSRHALTWYFATLSQIGAVYGALTSAIAVLLSLEVGATLLLFGAQVIAEFERLAWPEASHDVAHEAEHPPASPQPLDLSGDG